MQLSVISSHSSLQTFTKQIQLHDLSMLIQQGFHVLGILLSTNKIVTLIKTVSAKMDFVSFLTQSNSEIKRFRLNGTWSSDLDFLYYFPSSFDVLVKFGRTSPTVHRGSQKLAASCNGAQAKRIVMTLIGWDSSMVDQNPVNFSLDWSKLEVHHGKNGKILRKH